MRSRFRVLFVWVGLLTSVLVSGSGNDIGSSPRIGGHPIILQGHGGQGGVGELTKCPWACACSGLTVDCSHRALTQVPRNLPKDAERVKRKRCLQNICGPRKRLLYTTPTKLQNPSLRLNSQMKDLNQEERILSPEALIPAGIAMLSDVGQPVNNSLTLDTPKKKPRKVVPNPTKWKSNVRKQKHQSGESYVSRRGKTVSSKAVKTIKDCFKCKFKCSTKISSSERTELHTSYYALPYNEKRHFIIASSNRVLTSRPKRTTSDKKRAYSFKYYFTVKGEKIHVCKSFYLGTLDISQKPVYNAHLSKNIETNTPQPDKRGKSSYSRRTPTGDPAFAREHIDSIPKVESHYCRSRTQREYLGSNLSISKLYDLYLEKCKETSTAPVKLSMYHKIFVTEYNLGFHQPKSDRCDLCEKFKMAEKTNTLTTDLSEEYNVHILEKTAMREEAKRDKDSKTPVVFFDLENVINCPRAAISSFFYSRKLNVYNMTAVYSVTNQVYCALWTETLAGREGNDIASAVRKILDVIAEENNISALTTWSDSCVPQNRNSMMSFAMMDFLKEHEEINSVTMKYSVPGHSCVQLVDNAHSLIEKAMQKSEFYSPVSLIRVLKQANVKKPFRIIQMKQSDFKDFSEISKLMNYKSVPFTKVATLKFTHTYHEIGFKTSHLAFEPMNLGNLKSKEVTPKRSCSVKGKESSRPISVFNLKPKVDKKHNEISELKKKDIKSMLPLIPLQDRDYFKVVLKL